MSMEMILLDKQDISYDPFEDEKCELIRYRGNYPLYECMCKHGVETNGDFLVFSQPTFLNLMDDVKKVSASTTHDQEEWERIYRTLQQIHANFPWDNQSLVVYLSF